MRELEKRERQRIRKTRIQTAILESVKAAGILGVALLAPNAIKMLKEFGFMPKVRQKEYIPSSASKLVKKGLLKFNGKYYELTKTGERILNLWRIEDYGLKKSKRWDGKKAQTWI